MSILNSMTRRWLATSLIVLIAAYPQLATGQVNYIVIDLGTLGGTSSFATAINDLGQIVGNSLTAGNVAAHAFRTAPNGSISSASDLRPLGYGNSYAQGINSFGQVIGELDTGSVDHAFRTAPDGGITPASDLGSLGGVSVANGINDAGQVVGGSQPTGNGVYFHGFRTTAAGSIVPTSDLGDLGGIQNTSARGINAFGQVVGDSNTANNTNHAFRTAANGNITPASDLGTLGGDLSQAFGINASGQVVGLSATAGDVAVHAFRTAPNGSITPASDLGSLGGVSNAESINDSGKVVGYSYNAANTTMHAFYANANGTMQDLNNLIPAGNGWVLKQATGINNKGQIVGDGIAPNGQAHAFLLNPITQDPITYKPLPPEVPVKLDPPPNTPIPRLAQWQDGQWVPISPHSLGQSVHVLVHGWAPEELNWVQGQKAKNLPYNIWDNPTYFSNFSSLAAAMQAKDPNSNVVAFSWIDESATPDLKTARQSRRWTDHAGQLLAYYLDQALPSFYGDLETIQLFGHSHGARVATIAAELFAQKGVNIHQLTLADSPEGSFTLQGGIAYYGGAANDLSPALKTLKLARQAEGTFVDNYSSIFGVPYRDGSDKALKTIVDVQLQPNVFFDWTKGHNYPIDWYTKATKIPNTQDGLAWTPALNPTNGANLDSSYAQDWQSFPGVFNSEYETRLQGSGGHVLNGSPNTGAANAAANSMVSNIDPQTVRSVSAGSATIYTVGNVVTSTNNVQLTESGDAVWMGQLNAMDGDNMLTFNYQFANPGDGDQLGIWIDSDLQFLVTGVLSGTNLQSSQIDISDLSPGYHTLSIGLYSFASANAIVNVSNLAITNVPEPTAGFLLCASLVAAIGFRPRRPSGCSFQAENNLRALK